MAGDMKEKQRLQLLHRLMASGQGVSARDPVPVDRDTLGQLLELAFGTLVDEPWYAKRYPDVDKALKNGGLPSARAHYFGSGLYEGRVPYGIRVDGAAYLKKHKDVAAAVRSGVYRDGADHFLTQGFAEGRDFTLKAGVLRRGRA